MSEPKSPLVRRCVILAVLSVQLAVPAHYYLSEQSSPMDERFAWRMFSPIRMARCSVRVFDAEQPLRLSKTLHVVWSNLLARGRPAVIRGVAEHLCTRSESGRVRMDIRCGMPDGTTWVAADPAENQCEHLAFESGAL